MEIQSPDRLVRLAVDLVNTRTRDPEQLNEPGDVRTFLLEHGESEPITLDEHDLAEVRAVRERIRPVFHVEPAEAARLLNELIEEYAVRPYLSDHDGSAWHLHGQAGRDLGAVAGGDHGARTGRVRGLPRIRRHRDVRGR